MKAQIRHEGADQPQTPLGAPFPDSRALSANVIAYDNALKAAGADNDNQKEAERVIFVPVGEEIAARAGLATQTAAGFRERWALFWSNHFTVSVTKNLQVAAVTPSFEREAIRPTPLRASPADELLHQALEAAIARKRKGHGFIIDSGHSHAPAVSRHMSVTGG